MLVDLHAHFPMHVVTDVSPKTALDAMRTVRGQPTLKDKGRALVLKLASRLLNDESFYSGYRISVPQLRDGQVGVVLSVLYCPFEEMDLGTPYGARPSPTYFKALLADLERVQAAVEANDRAVIRVVATRAELDQCLTDGATALVHCVEGGFHLGDTDSEITANVAALAHRGVAYITVAHLFFRQVATNAPAIPFLPDWIYDQVFKQQAGEGLTERGRALVRAMVANGMLVDLSHMHPDSVAETFELMDQIDGARTVPVISSHAGYRFGKQTYMHDRATIEKLAARDGVIGLIMAQHQLTDGLPQKKTHDLDESMKVICAHIDQIKTITGTHRHVAIGSDLDGFIKPTMGGIPHIGAMRQLEGALRQHYGDADAKLMTSENALRVVRHALRP